MKSALLTAGVICCLIISVSAVAADDLPDYIDVLSIGDEFDTRAGNVSVFQNADGELDYVWRRPDDNFAVNVGLDEEGRIARLAWHEIAESNQQAQKMAEKYEQEYQSFFSSREPLDQGYALLFESEERYLVIRVEGTMITFEIIKKGAGFAVEL